MPKTEIMIPITIDYEWEDTRCYINNAWYNGLSLDCIGEDEMLAWLMRDEDVQDQIRDDYFDERKF